MSAHILLAAALATASTPAPPAEGLPQPAIGETASIVPALPPAPPQLVLPKGSMVRLMVLREVNSRDHKAGHKFVLRVDEDVKVGTTIVIPVGAKAWGEVTSSYGTAGVGEGGKLNVKLLHIEAGGRQIPLDGERKASGGDSTGQVVGAVVAFGIFGLLAKGNNATLKAGEIFNGYTLEDASFGVAAASLQ